MEVVVTIVVFRDHSEHQKVDHFEQWELGGIFGVHVPAQALHFHHRSLWAGERYVSPIGMI